MSETQQEYNFAELLEQSFKSIRRGEIIEGTVIDVSANEIYVNIGYKSDGIIPKSEYTNDPSVDLVALVKAGDAIKAKVQKINDGEGQVLLTVKRMIAEEGYQKLKQAYEDKEPITAEVKMVLKGGLIFVIDEVRIFMPASLVSSRYVSDLKDYMGKELTFMITEVNIRKRRIIANRKILIEKENNEKADALFSRIQVGDKVDGQVKSLTSFGAFINIDGVDGLLHISEMSWGRVKNPKDKLKIGDTVHVLIKDLDKENKKLGLSLKFPEENPWTDAENKYAVGTTVTGQVERMVDFGAFVEIEPGLDALLHVSQISTAHVEKPSDVLKIGESITAKVTDINPKDKKISISVKALEQDQKQESEENEQLSTEEEA